MGMLRIPKTIRVTIGRFHTRLQSDFAGALRAGIVGSLTVWKRIQRDRRWQRRLHF